MERREVVRTLQTAGQLFVRETGQGEAPSRKICGYAILFNVESVVLFQGGKYEEREIIEPCAVSKEFLDSCDIKFTMYHNRQIVLARSNKGKGTLSYRIDNKGVYFEFDAPKTQHGDEALELVKRGDLNGCSFIFTTYYDDDEYVYRTAKMVNGIEKVTCHVRKMLAIYDFTIAADPAYPDTSIEARELQEQARRNASDRMERDKLAKELRQAAGEANESGTQAPVAIADKALAKHLRDIAKSIEP